MEDYFIVFVQRRKTLLVQMLQVRFIRKDRQSFEKMGIRNIVDENAFMFKSRYEQSMQNIWEGGQESCRSLFSYFENSTLLSMGCFMRKFRFPLFECKER
jgi:hypothetical protein